MERSGTTNEGNAVWRSLDLENTEDVVDAEDELPGERGLRGGAWERDSFLFLGVGEMGRIPPSPEELRTADSPLLPDVASTESRLSSPRGSKDTRSSVMGEGATSSELAPRDDET